MCELTVAHCARNHEETVTHKWSTFESLWHALIAHTGESTLLLSRMLLILTVFVEVSPYSKSHAFLVYAKYYHPKP